MERTSEDDDTLIEAARFEGMYKDGSKTGFGKMVYPSGDIYEGEWFENQVHKQKRDYYLVQRFLRKQFFLLGDLWQLN